jgi:hypothetical protein
VIAVPTPPRVILHLGGPACGGGAVRQVLAALPERIDVDGADLEYWRLVVRGDRSVGATRVDPDDAEHGASDPLAGFAGTCLHDLLAVVLDEVADGSLVVLSRDGWGSDLAWSSRWSGCRPSCAGEPVDAVLLVRPQVDLLPVLHGALAPAGVSLAQWLALEESTRACDWNAHVEGALRAGVRRVEVAMATPGVTAFAEAVGRLTGRRTDASAPTSAELGRHAERTLTPLLDSVDELLLDHDRQGQRSLAGLAREHVADALRDLAATSAAGHDAWTIEGIPTRFAESNAALAEYARSGTDS